MFEQLVDEARSAAGEDPAGLCDASVALSVTDLAVSRERNDAAFLLHLGPLVAREIWKADGALSPVPWLVNRSSLSTGEARVAVRVGRLLVRYERLTKLLAAGDLSADHCRVLARFAIPPRFELVDRDIDLLCDLALRLCVDDYATVLARWASYADDQLGRGEPKDIHDRRGVSISYHGGMGELHARGLAGDIAEIERRLDLHAPPDPTTIEGGPRTRAQRRYDALCDLINRGAAAANGGRRSAPDRAFTVIADEVTFNGGFNPDGRCETSTGVTIPSATAQRFACDSTWRGIVFDANGEVLCYGRAKRLFTPQQRAAVMVRDRTCIFDDCHVPASDCEIHHVHHYEHGGPTDIDNAAAVCWAHHPYLHERRWRAIRGPDGRWRAVPP